MKFSTILSAMVFAVTSNAFSQIEFTTHIITPSADATTDNATYVFAIDLDGDDDIDILSASWLDGKIAWYENDGTQRFRQHIITTDANGASWLYAVDMDGDADIDVLSASMLNDRVTWYENDSNQNFTAHIIDASQNPTGWLRFSVYAFDVDSDGDMDALSGSWDSNEIKWHENDGNQNFTTHLIENQGGHSSVYAIDMDEDGDADVLSASQLNNTVAWYENDGNQNFTTHVITNAAGGARTVKATDLDEDGDMDVLAGCWEEKIEWYENDGSQNFTIHTIASSAYASGSIYIIDVDNDGDLDILSSTKDQNMIAWMENDGEENFSLHIITTGAIGADTVFGADVDGDGDIDALSAGLEGDQIAWYENSLITPVVSPVPDGAQVAHLTGDIVFAEGPLWHPDGFLLCSDLNGNRIYKIDPETGTKEVYLSPSGGANGLALDAQQNLIMCRRDEHDLARFEADGSVTVLVADYDGTEFNRPNDLTVRSDGTIFFTDPAYLNRTPPQIDGIYALKPDGEIMRLDSTVSAPNGICLSPDEKKLYVNATRVSTIYVFDIETDLTLTNKMVFAQISDATFVDGMKVDEKGRLFVAAFNAGVWIFSPDGEFVDKISVPQNVTNLNWGNVDYQTLYITAINSATGGNSNVYKIRLNTKGVVTAVAHTDASVPTGFELLQNYPNPFNPTTTISYNVPLTRHVELKIYNTLGQEIRTLVNAVQPIGTHQVVWDGRDDNDAVVASGVYFYRLQAGSIVETRKMLFIR